MVFNRQIVRNLLYIVGVIVLVVFLRAQFVDVDNVMITINVPGNSTVEEVEEVLDVFALRNATGTFFIPGGWAELHPALLEFIAERHELACYTHTETRLVQLDNESLRREIADCASTFANVTGVPVAGFRAPANDVGVRSYELILESYEYDSSRMGRYQWFWEEPPTGFVEVPVTSLLFLPLDDWFGNDMLFLGDFFYFLAKQAKQDPVVIALTVGTVNEHLLDLEYLIAHYQQEANITTMREWVQSGT